MNMSLHDFCMRPNANPIITPSRGLLVPSLIIDQGSLQCLKWVVSYIGSPSGASKSWGARAIPKLETNPERDRL